MKNLFICGSLLLLIGFNGDGDAGTSGECQAVEIFISSQKQLESCFASNLFFLVSSDKSEKITMDSMKSCDEIKSSAESRLQNLETQKKIPEGFLKVFFSHAHDVTSLNPRIRVRRAELEELCRNKAWTECKKKLAQSVMPLLQGKCLNFIEQGKEAQFTECFVKEFLEAGHQALRTQYNCK